MIELKDYQKRNVRKLKEQIIEMLNRDTDRQKIVFKAPTGSGKTVMVSTLLDELTQDLPANGDCVYTRVAWLWIAPNKLHQQSYMSMRSFFSETRNLRPVMFDECDMISGLQSGDVLFVNWESINKDNAVMIRDNEQNRTLIELLRRTQIQQGVPIVCIIDEEHMFAGRNARKSEQILRSINPKIELRISATPQTAGVPLIEIPRSDVIKEEMIKKAVVLNKDVKAHNEQKQFSVNQQLLSIALKKRNELAKAYRQYNINPLLLIQLPNDSSESMNPDEKTIAEEMINYLQYYEDITTENGKLAIWLSNRKDNLTDLSKPDNLAEVLLFKQAIALGWDCPRAAVLLIFRDVQSVSFTTQTVGRILRMPEQRHYQDDKLNYGYVYTNIATNMIQIVADDMNYLTTIYANRRKDLNNIELQSSSILYSGQKKNNLYAMFKQIFFQTLSDYFSLAQTSLNADSDFFESDEDIATPQQTDLDNLFSINRLAAKKCGLQLDVSQISIEIPKDIRITIDEGEVEVIERARLVRTNAELITLFNYFCKQHVHPYTTTDSATVLRGAIEESIERLFGYFTTDVPKIVLYKYNKPIFEEIIRLALDRYAKQQAASKKTASLQTTIWTVPESRLYNSEQVEAADDIYNHALQPYLQSRRASNQEKGFAKWIDAQNDIVDWWYKNGDDGKQHFAVPYLQDDNQPHCFYVDFIIRLKNGTICLFDTKTIESDLWGANKNNALYQYCQEQSAKSGRKIEGGVLIAQNDNWYYPDGQIENTADLTGWKCLDLRKL